MQADNLFLEVSSSSQIEVDDENDVVAGNVVSLVTTRDEPFNFSRLPWVIFLTILEFFQKAELCRLCLVNKLWCKACRDPSLWRCLDLSGYNSVTDDDLTRLTSFSRNVAKLNLSVCGRLTDAGVVSVLRQCSSLVELVITDGGLSDQVLEAVGEYCHCLRKLDVTLCFKFTDKGFSKVCQGCPKLEEFVIDQCPRPTSETLVSLGNHCPMLKSISTERIANITDNGLVSLVQGCPNLQTLRLPFCGLTNQCIAHVIYFCRNILWLDLRGIPLNDTDVCGLVESYPRLECLNLSLCYNLTDRSALEISRNCKSIKYLFLVNNKVTDQGLFQLGEHCKSLQHLDVSWCPAVTQVGARHVITGCPNLKHLGLVRCDQVSESAVSELNSYFPHVFLSTVRTEMSKFFSRERSQDIFTCNDIQ